MREARGARASSAIDFGMAVVWTITHWSYDYCFYAMVVLHPLAFLIVRRFATQEWRLT